jgi:hypothetical protein
VNGSQSKFFTRTWPISQIEPDVSLFYLGQDHIAIEVLLVLGTRLVNKITLETQLSAK